jgi:hypothetical protein
MAGEPVSRILQVVLQSHKLRAINRAELSSMSIVSVTVGILARFGRDFREDLDLRAPSAASMQPRVQPLARGRRCYFINEMSIQEKSARRLEDFNPQLQSLIVPVER